MSLWSCTTCFKSFSRKGDLTRHESLHTGIKPHVCETCGKGFAQFSGLKTHRNVHSMAKPYVCGIGTCAKAFGDPSSRTRHRKETHRREGTYECVVTGCGTRIKRRSAFVAHLRKHGIDPNLLDLDSTTSRSKESWISGSIHSTLPVVERKCIHKVESGSVSPCLLGNTFGCYTSDGDSVANYLMDNNGWLGDNLLDHRRANWSPANDALLFGQTMNIDLSGLPHDTCPSLTSDFKSPSFLDGVFPTSADCPLLVTSPLKPPVLGPFLRAGSDGPQSSSSSLSLAYSTLYSINYDCDVVSLPLANNTVYRENCPCRAL